MATNRVNFLDVLPSETITAIVDEVPLEDYLPLKLTCRAMAAHMPKPLKIVLCEREGLNQGQNRFRTESRYIGLLRILEHRERGSRHKPVPNYLLCTVCGKIKARETFVDSQRKIIRDDRYKPQGSIKNRIGERCCIHCQYFTRHGAQGFGKRESVIVDGVRQFACVSCEKYVSVNNRWTGEVEVRRLNADMVRWWLRWRYTEAVTYLKLSELCVRCAKLIKSGPVPDEVLKEIRRY